MFPIRIRSYRRESFDLIREKRTILHTIFPFRFIVLFNVRIAAFVDKNWTERFATVIYVSDNNLRCCNESKYFESLINYECAQWQKSQLFLHQSNNRRYS